MAATRLFSVRILSHHLKSGPLRKNNTLMPARKSSVYTNSGGLNSRPDQVSLGVVKVAAVVFPTLYVGATISKSFAAFLEENDIFVPDDDDD